MTSFGVPSSALGYLYQLRYALWLFLRAVQEYGPTIELSLERTDDIGLDAQGASVSLVQTKHHSQSGTVRPVSLTDASPDLWKTLRIWSEGFGTGSIRIPGTLLYLVSTAEASDGTAASLLRLRDRNVDVALLRLRAVAETSRSQENAPAYAAFSRLSQSEQRAMLDEVRILDGSPNIGDVRGLLARQLAISVDDRAIEGFLDRLEGWWVNRAIAHLRAGADDRISGIELIRAMQELLRQLRDERLPIDDDLVDAEALKAEDHERRVFVRQLRLVRLRETGIWAAIQDYYRAFVQRSRWARDELLHLNELAHYERRLTDEWRQAFAIMESTCPDDDDGRALAGLALFGDLSQRHLPIRRDCPDGFIARGSFHILADDLRVGWHMDFVDRLREHHTEN